MSKKTDIGRIINIPGDGLHRIGFVRVSPGHPAAPQIAALKAAGFPNYYSTADGEDLDDLLRWVRKPPPGCEVGVLGLHRLGATLADLTRALNHFAALRVSVYDIEKDARPTVKDLASVKEATAVITGEARSAAKKKSLKNGGNPGGRPRRGGGVSEAKALKIWKDLSIPTNKKAADKARWPLRSMSRKFGASGRPVGWPRGTTKRTEE